MQEGTTDFGPLPELTSSARQAVVVTDVGGAIQHWNSFAEELYGWSRSEVIGRPAADVMPAPDAVALAETIHARIIAGSSWAGTFRVRHRAGTEFEIHVIGTPVYIEGKAAGVLTVAIPATSVAPLGDDVGVLTPREREVLRFSAEGHSSAGIAQTLGISRRTVESHRASIHRKLGTASQAELILFALRHGLVRFSSDR